MLDSLVLGCARVFGLPEFGWMCAWLRFWVVYFRGFGRVYEWFGLLVGVGCWGWGFLEIGLGVFPVRVVI